MNENNLVNQFEGYLVNGKYQNDSMNRIIFKNELEKSSIVEKYKSEIGEENFATKEVLVKSENKKFMGDIVWFSAGGGYKIFSKLQVLSFVDNRVEFDTKLDNYNYFSKYFRIPKLKIYDQKNMILSEQLIDFEEHNQGEELLKSIFEDYNNYFANLKIEDIKNINFIEIQYSNHPFKNLISILINSTNDNILNQELPFIKLHGDLWSSNILREKKSNDLYYIDWDTANNYVFFYDIFRFFWNELDVLNNDYIFQYLGGKYDYLFDRLFRNFNLKYDNKNRESYIFIFFINYLIDETLPINIKEFEVNSFKEKVLKKL
ncbi:hypothetical protein BG261_01770 [Floricoccus tropicus]|uniref:Aminoglycoside phosphotransferase domain-containing protein n=1 Tax=Floricoccus tropicus TaxID=1859473 RepID=A0A1E8GM60_9LACT|nr:hypothetical protein [Floricoccus tropicus]OFI49335.1 hypothetical protein BG261_01770 [Floricoccus tropicus]